MAEGFTYQVEALLTADASRLHAAVGGAGRAVADVYRKSAGTAGAAFGTALKVGVVGGAAAVGGAVHKVISEGMALRTELDATTNQIGATLRLFGHVSYGVGEGATAAEQFAANIREAEGLTKDLVRVADASPGSYQQVADLFKAILPAARGATSEMSEIVKLTERATLLGGVMGGRFEFTGSQIGQIIGGSIGMDNPVYRLLHDPIKAALVDMGKLKDSASNLDMLKALKLLSAEERLRVISDSMMKLGPEVAEHFSNSWEGATSTLESKVRDIYGSAAAPIFDQLKAKAIALTTGSGQFAAGSAAYLKLKDAAAYLGTKLGGYLSTFIGVFERSIAFFADNYKPIIDGLERAFKVGLKAAQIYAAARIARGAGAVAGASAGFMMQGAGHVMSLLKQARAVGETFAWVVRNRRSIGEAVAGRKVSGQAGLTAWMQQAKPQSQTRGAPFLSLFTGMVTRMGLATAMAAPAILLFGAAALGVGVLFAGVAAYFVSNWTSITEMIQTGAVSLDPVFDAVDILWAKLVAAGEAFMGTSDVAGTAQGTIDAAGTALQFLTAMMGSFLRVAAYTHQGFLLLDAGVSAIYLGFVAVIEGIAMMVHELLAVLPGAGDIADAVGGGLEAIKGHRQSVVARIDEDAAKMHNNSLHRAADAFENAWMDPLKSPTAELRKKAAEGTLFGGGTEDPPPKTTTVNIGTQVVHVNARTNDPARLMTAFLDHVKEAAVKPTSTL